MEGRPSKLTFEIFYLKEKLPTSYVKVLVGSSETVWGYAYKNTKDNWFEYNGDRELTTKPEWWAREYSLS